MVLTQVHELLGRLQPCVGASLVVELRRFAALERLEARVVDELRLLDDAERQVRAAIIRSLRHVAPVQEVVVVDDAPPEVALAQHRNVVRRVAVRERVHKAVAQARLADADRALLVFADAQPDDAHVERTGMVRLLFLSHRGERRETPGSSQAAAASGRRSSVFSIIVVVQRTGVTFNGGRLQHTIQCR